MTAGCCAQQQRVQIRCLRQLSFESTDGTIAAATPTPHTHHTHPHTLNMLRITRALAPLRAAAPRSAVRMAAVAPRSFHIATCLQAPKRPQEVQEAEEEEDDNESGERR
jgi:hypothetical protein